MTPCGARQRTVDLPVRPVALGRRRAVEPDTRRAERAAMCRGRCARHDDAPPTGAPPEDRRDRRAPATPRPAGLPSRWRAHRRARFAPRPPARRRPRRRRGSAPGRGIGATGQRLSGRPAPGLRPDEPVLRLEAGGPRTPSTRASAPASVGSGNSASAAVPRGARVARGTGRPRGAPTGRRHALVREERAGGLGQCAPRSRSGAGARVAAVTTPLLTSPWRSIRHVEPSRRAGGGERDHRAGRLGDGERGANVAPAARVDGTISLSAGLREAPPPRGGLDHPRSGAPAKAGGAVPARTGSA